MASEQHHVLGISRLQTQMLRLTLVLCLKGRDTVQDYYSAGVAWPNPETLTQRTFGAVCSASALLTQLHAVNWLYKALRADNIIFFSSSGLSDLDAPFDSGFELSRPSNMDQWTEKPGFEPAKDIYRHPNAQSSQTDGSYRKLYDIYSLGVVMTEVVLWKRIEDVVGLVYLPNAKPLTFRGIQLRLLEKSLTGNAADTESCLQQVASACGDSLHDVVERCLGLDAEVKPEYSSTTLRLQKATELDMVKKLEHVAEAI